MNNACPRCHSGFFQKRFGYSQTDRIGECYEYGFCLICGHVKHVLNQGEHDTYVREIIDRMNDNLMVNVVQNNTHS